MALFEEAFDGFAPRACAMMSDDKFDRLLKDTRIVRHAAKIVSLRENAVFLLDLEEEHGSGTVFFAESPPQQYVSLLDTLMKRAARLGGISAHYFLRQMGVDSVVFSGHVEKALIREGVVQKKPSSKKDMAQCQEVFNQWLEEDGVTLTKISRVLAMTVNE